MASTTSSLGAGPLSAGLGLRKYQKASIEWLAKTGRRYLGAHRGTGKTVMALKAARQLTKGNILVVCPKVAIGVWQDEIEKWLPEEAASVATYTGTPSKRVKLRKSFDIDGYPSFTITPYSMVGEIVGFKSQWSAIIIDEAHLARNRNTQTFKNLARLRSRYVLPLSGSPIVNKAYDLWGLLYLIAPDNPNFRGYWPFVMRNFAINKGYFGTEILGLKNPPVFRRMIEPYLLHLKAKDVLPELPPKTRQMARLEMTPDQAKLYKEIAEEAIAEVENKDATPQTSTLILAPNAMAKIVRLRQLLITPALLGGTHQSPMFQALEEYLQLDFDAKDSAVVFTPFTQAIPYIVELLTRIKAMPYVVRGGMSAAHIRQTVKEFQGNKSPRKAAVISLLSASSITLTEANHGYFVGYDWAPSNNWQAEDRIYRISQTKPCVLVYFMYDSTVDERMREVVSGKYNTIREALPPTPRAFLLPSR
jgi:SNF2 family DNA or RNA helicase